MSLNTRSKKLNGTRCYSSLVCSCSPKASPSSVSLGRLPTCSLRSSRVSPLQSVKSAPCYSYSSSPASRQRLSITFHSRRRCSLSSFKWLTKSKVYLSRPWRGRCVSVQTTAALVRSLAVARTSSWLGFPPKPVSRLRSIHSSGLDGPSCASRCAFQARTSPRSKRVGCSRYKNTIALCNTSRVATNKHKRVTQSYTLNASKHRDVRHAELKLSRVFSNNKR
mmetsp:Transcript_688/g.2193  ORF Transcript_688/g.2193 Transcript_688/m.2193 type:complete len:222 (-) Transcript_688:816-1481(-)